MSASLKKFPEIAQAYNLYLLARIRTPYVHKFSRNGSEYSSLMFVTTGLGLLPDTGGLLDQEERLSVFFEQFLDGDQIGFSQKMNSMR